MARRIVVDLGERSYPIVVATTDAAAWTDLIRTIVGGKQVAVVSDTQVAGIYQTRLTAALQKAGAKILTWCLVAPGEMSKSPNQLNELYSQFLSAGFGRDGLVCAFGGGVVGDLAGFVAATIHRGVSWVQVPTSLLAMVDAAIGGKTGINHSLGKNLIGAFHQPDAVLINVPVLQTLCPKELRSGLAEVIKYGVIGDTGLFENLEQHSDEIASVCNVSILEIVARSATMKVSVVSRDEREAGPRMILNFGHTLGHAIEATAGFGSWTHGEAVAVGMVLAAEFGVHLGRTRESVPNRITGVCQSFDLPTSIDSVHLKALGKAVRYDKKVRGEKINFVVPVDIGEAEIASVELKELITWLKRDERRS